MSDQTITERDVQKEHLREVSPGTHWAYLFGVLAGGLVLMLLLMALLGAGTS
jgi:hypothetical protein